jgi:hypothetical protein
MKTTLKISLAYLLPVFLVFTACKNRDDKAWKELPEVTSLSSLKQTEFVPTLENRIPGNANVIYAPAFLFAWNKIEETLKSETITENTNSDEFVLLTKSKSYEHVLADNEYSVTTEINGREIIARAFFNKTLPFETKLQSLEKPIQFKSEKVLAFGMQYFDEDAVKFSRILHYQDDDNFILQLAPKDKQHEIILVKGLPAYNTFSEAVNYTRDRIETGKKELTDPTGRWRYEIKREDIFSIPVIKFNIDTDYKNIEGQNFKTKDKASHVVAEAYQRTGFILNENGAVIESEAIAVTDSSVVVVAPPRPKKMIFDKPFLVIVKRVDQKNPYFVMKVDNAELLVRKKTRVD